MGWAQGYYDFPVKTKRAEIMERIEESLYCERGAMEPVQLPFVFLDIEPFATRKDAISYLNSKECRQYYRSKNVGVRYKNISNTKPTKKMEDLHRRIEETITKRQAYIEAHSVKNFKAEYVGCPNCGSKLKRTLLHDDRCPLCNSDMRSETTLKTINGYMNKIHELQKEVEEEMKKMSKKGEDYWVIDASVYLG